MRVMVIYSDQNYSSNFTPFPPVGAVGEVVSDIDHYGEFDVIFDGYPCHETMPIDPSWITHRRMVVEVSDKVLERTEEFEAVCARKSAEVSMGYHKNHGRSV